jgi:hypothetical protein
MRIAATAMDDQTTYPKAEGVGQFEALIHPPQAQPPLLSFWNLVEVHVLRALRSDYAVSIRAVREALSFAEQPCGYVKKKGGRNYFNRVHPVLCTVGSWSDADGIVRR